MHTYYAATYDIKSNQAHDVTSKSGWEELVMLGCRLLCFRLGGAWNSNA